MSARTGKPKVSSSGKQAAGKPAGKKPAGKPAGKKPAGKPPAAQQAAAKPAGKPPAGKAPATKPSAARRPAVAATPAAGKRAARPRAATDAAPPPAPRPAPPRPEVPDDPRSQLLVDGATVGAMTLHLHDLPALHLPSGQIVVGDPFAARGVALAERVRPGAYPVTMVVGDGGGDARPLAAFVQVSNRPVASWTPATAADGSSADHAVDAAAGCFADARAFAAITDETAGFPTPSYRALEHQLLTEHYAPSWGWASYAPTAAAPGTCVAFTSGGADRHASWWGRDAAGALAVLLTRLG